MRAAEEARDDIKMQAQQALCARCSKPVGPPGFDLSPRNLHADATPSRCTGERLRVYAQAQARKIAGEDGGGMEVPRHLSCGDDCAIGDRLEADAHHQSGEDAGEHHHECAEPA